MEVPPPSSEQSRALNGTAEFVEEKKRVGMLLETPKHKTTTTASTTVPTTKPDFHSLSVKRQRATSIAEETEILVFAIPKKGRLFELCSDLLMGSGLIYKRNPRLDIAFVNTSTLKIKLVFLPAQDIARFVAEGNVDLGLTGQDMIAENNVYVAGSFLPQGEARVDLQLETGFGVCQLAVQAPKADGITDVKQLCGKRLATSFPFLTELYFKQICDKQNGLEMPKIRYISGSVETACALGLADAVVDLVETGTTMEEAGLEKVDVVLRTQAVLISNPHTSHKQEIETIKKRMQGYLFAQLFSMMYYNISRSNLAEAEKVTPGRQAPTISPLDDPQWVSVGAMVPKRDLAEVMDRLQRLGAKDILCMNIDNCRA